MKRKLLIGFATIGLLLTACSQDEVVSGIGAITFSGTYVDNHTRATNNSITKDNISEVYVYGYRSLSSTTDGTTTTSAGPIFNNERVYKDGGAWKYNNIQFWESNKKYAFTAITPNRTDGTNTFWTYTKASATDDVLAGKGSIVFYNETAKGEKDFCTSVQTTESGTISATNYPGDVKFTMKHRLARVMFRFKNGFQNTTDKIEVSKLQLNGAISQGTLTTSATEDSNTWSNTSGTFNLTFKTWTGNKSATDDSDTSEDISSTSPLTVDPNSQTDGTWSANEKETNTKFLIPSTATSYDVELYAEVKNASGVISTYDKTTTPATFSIPEGLQAGFSYVITVEFSGNEIKFTVYTVTPWDDETNIPIGTSSTPADTPQTIDISEANGIDDGTKTNVKYYDGEVSDIYLFQYADGLYKIKTSNDTNPRDLWGYEIEMHTYFTKSVDSEGDEIYYVTVPILTEFRIYMPLSDNLHKQWANQNSRLAFLWGDQWGTSTFSPNEYFMIQGYAGGGGDAAYVGDGKKSSDPILKDVTVAFKPSKNLLYLLDKQGEYSKPEFYPSNSGTAYPVGGYTLVEDEGEATNGLLGGVIINYKDTDIYGSNVVNIKWENEKTD
jgi:hypothetical protein